jgi:hypothetical protein
MISKVVKGNAPSLLNTEKANQLIDAINRFNALQIVYGESLEVLHGSKTLTITIPNPIEELKKKNEEEKKQAQATEKLMKKKIELCENGVVEEREFLIYPTNEELADSSNEFVDVLIL